jgi:hypothetical protein
MMIVTLATLLAQATPSPSPAMQTLPAVLDTRGPCLESTKQVPNVIGEPVAKDSEVVKIEKVVSLATYTPGQVIGFLYTRQDGKTFLGMRSLQYTSPASAQELNQVLASTHAPGVSETEFPPQTRLGVKTGYSQFFEVKLLAAAMDPLQVRLDPCVAWPAGRPLPDPASGP